MNDSYYRHYEEILHAYYLPAGRIRGIVSKNEFFTVRDEDNGVTYPTTVC